MIQLTDTTWQSDNGLITFIQGDCMEFMAGCKDNEFELAVVDVPYGEQCNLKGGSSSKGTNGWSGKLKKANTWNFEPNEEYFTELFRISKNQIIWGANHFINLLPQRFPCFLIWDKGQRDFSLADGEMAWTSFNSAARFFNYSRSKALQEGKIHPTQKPIALYRWIFKNYAKPTDHILDTHGGSFSSAIAAHMEGLRMTIIELDHEYFNAAITRFATYEAQQTIKFD